MENAIKEVIKQLNIKDKDIDELSEKIVNSFKEGETESIKIWDKLKLSKDINDMYQIIIDIKTNYLKISKSDFSIIYNNSIGYDGTNFPKNRIKDCSLKALVFYQLFKSKLFFDLNKFKSQFVQEALQYQKFILLYKSVNQYINEINSTASIGLKLPVIEDFEIEIFNRLKLENEKQSKHIKSINELYKKRFDNLKIFNEEERKNYKKKLKKLKQTEEEFSESLYNLSEYKSKYSAEKTKREFYEKEYEKQYQYNLKREPIYIIQFDNTVWGDNYPALKILYKFLFEYYDITFNWSFFTYVMTVENKDFININILKGGISKSKTGFLLFKIKEFFIPNVEQNYYYWLSKKIYINNKSIDRNYFSNYIHERTIDFSNQDYINTIESVYKKITNTYIKL